MNDGIKQVVALKNNAFVRSLSSLLVTGTKQTIPLDGIQFIKAFRNMGVSGAVPGAAIRLEEQRLFDDQRPNWHMDTASAVAQRYMFDPRDPKTYYVWPPQPSTGQGQVEIVYSAVPVDILINQAIPIDDIYSMALIDYIAYRDYSKDGGNAVNAAAMAQSYLASFTAGLSGKISNETAYHPAESVATDSGSKSA